MQSSINLVLLSLGISAYAMDQLPDKLVNRANQKNDDDLSEDLDDTVMAKGPAKAPPGKEKEITYQETDSNAAYKNGVMGPNRVWGGFKESEKLADKIGMDQPWKDNPIEAFFQEANSKLVDADLALGETGKFGDKSKFYPKGSFENPLEGLFGGGEEDSKGKARALPGATAPQYNMLPQRGLNPLQQKPVVSSVRGPAAQVPWNRGPLPRLSETYADSMSTFAVVLIGLMTGSGVAFAFQRLRSRTVNLQ